MLIPLQEGARRIAEDKHTHGQSVDAMKDRLALALAAQEAHPEQWQDAFRWTLDYAFPGGRILANAGVTDRNGASTINCTVSRTISDSMVGIMDAATEAALTLKSGAGIGYDFSTLRPAGAWVAGAGATTSGPLPFMDVFDAVCKTVSSAGGRRGAQMGCLDISHPDIEAFITAKRQPGRLRAFNVSCLLSDAFVEAVKEGREWALAFPAFAHELQEEGQDIVWRRWPQQDAHYTVNEIGEVACRVYRRVAARDLWDLIMSSTYEFSDPGFVMADEVNRMNPLWFCEWIRATNPCGEQPLPAHGACLLGSVNLASLVQRPFTPEARFDEATFARVVGTFTRMLDIVVDINNLPLPQQREEILRKRRHGTGIFGLGSAMTMLGIRYGSAESVQFTESICRQLALHSWRAGLQLAREKGAAPVLSENFEVTQAMMQDRPEMAEHGISIGDQVPGRVLHARYSRYMQRLAEVDPELVDALAETGARFSHATSIAPTGTMAAGVGNNASNGIEPTFSHEYTRNLIVPGRKAKDAIRMTSYELLAYRQSVDPEATADALPDSFASAHSVSPTGHVNVMAAAQRWIDSAVSKTINVPTDMPYGEFKELYLYMIDKGLKGGTTFRYNPAAQQAVLVTDEDLAGTTYEFTLQDGSRVRARGNERVEYEGEVYTAGNLYHALKEGDYGR